MRTVDLKEQNLFLDAIEIDSVFERERFLNEQCRGNEELRKRVLHLIELHGAEGFVLDEPIDDPLEKLETEREGQDIGPYRLIRRLGEGGMGSVWRAEQTRPVRRDVAIKIIKLGMDTRNVIARFQAERQALAMMDHPCITKVFDAGATESGRPYFVMELVDGVHITAFCNRNRLTITQRLELFSQVCQAVQHAHQKGLIHRDIKPSNVLITMQDDKPTPKIIDFGIAKATHQRLAETTLMTQSSVAMIGTPQYMSPEQAEINNPNIDTRCDIYSLGVLLYEMLVGTTPFSGDHLQFKPYHQIREIILTHHPDPPSSQLTRHQDTLEKICDERQTDEKTLKRTIQGELDWIILKCLSKDRSLRYDTASDVAREIERFLLGEPVEAAAPTLWYRTTKFARKYRTALSVAAGVTLMLAVGVAISTGLAISASASADRAKQAESLANSRLDEANRAQQSAEFERQRAKLAEDRLVGSRRHQQNQLAMARAIARFNALAVEAAKRPPTPTRTTAIDGWQISPWMKQELGALDKILFKATTNPRSEEAEIGKQKMRQIDALLLGLLVEEQRRALDADDPHVADTLDLLAEHALNTTRLAQAETYVRESILIRVSRQNESIHHMRSLVLLGQTLSRRGKLSQARFHLNAARKKLQNMPEASNLLKLAEHELKLLKSISR